MSDFHKTDMYGYIINSNNIVINTNENELNLYYQQIKQSKEINSLQNDIIDLKKILSELIKKQNG